jgi:uncharacterized membrane protein
MFELGFIVVLLIIGIPALALMGFVKSRANERAIAELRRDVQLLSKTVQALRNPGAMREEAAPAVAEPPVEAAAAPRPMPESPGFAATPREEVFELDSESEIPSGARPARGREIKKIEDALTTRWLIWVGAIAIALAGVFLVKYAVDSELLTPAMRVALGLLLGLSLAAAGEVLRRKPLQRAIAAVRPNHVPPALTASGLFIAFASLYAGYALYNLIAPLVAFGGLALIALLAIGLSLLQGRFVALMGLLGAFVTPALISTNDPSAWTLFGYLLVVEFACVALSRYQRWAWFALATLAGTAVWPLLWMLGAWKAGDALPIGIYLLASAGAFFFLMRSKSPEEDGRTWLEDFQRWDLADRAVAIAGVTVALLLFILAAQADYDVVSLSLFGGMTLLYMFAGRREGMFDVLAAVAAVFAVLIVATMPVPQTVSLPAAFVRAPLIPHELDYFVRTAVAFGAIFGIGGFVSLWRAPRPAVWAGVSAFVPVLVFLTAYWRIVDFGVDLQWAAVAAALAAVSLFAAERTARHRTLQGLDVSLGFYAAAVVAFLSLAAAMSLREAWLTVALSLELPALAAIGLRIPARAIRVLAGIVAAAVVARLALNYNVLFYPRGDAGLWVLYGYGIPAIACFTAANWFRKTADDVLVTGLQAAGLAFAVLLISLEIRLFIAGSLAAQSYTLLEASVQTIAWLAIGTGLARRDARSQSLVARFGSRILLGAAAAQIVLVQLLAADPLVTNESIGRVMLIDTLALAYLAPAMFAFFFAASTRNADPMFQWQRPIAAVSAIVLLLIYVSFEVRHAYHGPILSTPEQGDAELYTYSAAWLIYGVVLLGAGIRTGEPMLRYAGLAILMLTSVKVFLIDMGDLAGLYRVASFLGLGLSLVGIGYLYQRFVNTRSADT